MRRGALAYARRPHARSPQAAALPRLRADGPLSHVAFPCHLLLINWNIVSAHHNFLGRLPRVSEFPFSGPLNIHKYEAILLAGKSFAAVISAENNFVVVVPEKATC